MTNESAPPQAVGSSDGLGPPLEDALKRAYYYTENGVWRGPEVDEWDRWHAVAKVAAAQVEAERENIKARLLSMDDAANGRHNYYAHAAWVLFERAERQVNRLAPRGRMMNTNDAGASPVEPTVRQLLQGGLNNAELLAAWMRKLPRVEPSERDLTAFAVGVEVGFEHARNLERQDWSRIHHALAKHGEHPGRTDDHLADVIDRTLARLKDA